MMGEMELSKQVVSLELAKQMKELGFEQDNSLFQYVERYELRYGGIPKYLGKFKLEYIGERYDLFHRGNAQTYSAYTVAELGAMLPEKIDDENLFSNKYNNTWQVGYIDKEFQYNSNNGHSATEADARAKMLIHLKQNNLM